MTRRLTASAARKDLSTAINRVAFGGERIVLQRRGKDVAAVVSVRDLELLEELDDRRDVEAAKKALAKPRNKPVPWTTARKRILGK